MKDKMRLLCMAVMALAGMALAGCQKEETMIVGDGVHFSTTVRMAGGGTKALDAAGHKTFAVGDQIAVVYTNTSGTTVKAVSAALTESNIHNSGKAADFSVELTDPDRTQDVTYIYPAAMANADGSVNYSALATQNGTLASLAAGLDLCTYTGSWSGGGLPSNVQLVNQLAICKLTLKQGATNLNGSITRLHIGDGTNGYYIERTASADPIWVAMRPVSSSQWLTFHAVGGSNKYEKELTGKTLAAGNIYPVSVGTTQLWQGALFGTFAVSASDTVHFSQGNLQIYKVAQGMSSARFAEHQYDFVGAGPANTTIVEEFSGYSYIPTPGTAFDLFGWSGDEYSNYGMHNSTDYQYYRGNFKEWGNRSIGNGGGEHQWRTLSIGEWGYLFYDRTDHNDKYFFADIYADGYKSGVVLLPEHWTLPDGCSTTTYTLDQWAKMEFAGAVFLPAGGERDSTNVGGDNAVGFYWSSSGSGNDAHRLYFWETYSSSFELGLEYSRGRYWGSSVRLVRNLNYYWEDPDDPWSF